MKKFLIISFTIAIAFLSCNDGDTRNDPYEKLKVGDIIFQSSMSGQSRAIQLATHSKYSHVGLLFINKGKWMVYEAVQPVCLTPLDIWIERGDNDHYVVKRLSNREEVFTENAKMEMWEYGKQFLGKDYDLYFGWSDERIYCSELVWKIYNEVFGVQLGELQALMEFDFSQPIVRSIAKERYGDKIPEKEMAISPGAIFNSEKLETVISRDRL